MEKASCQFAFSLGLQRVIFAKTSGQNNYKNIYFEWNVQESIYIIRK